MFSNIRFSMNISIKYDIGINTQNCQHHTHRDPYHHTPTLPHMKFTARERIDHETY